jgi:hypothetical protein
VIFLALALCVVAIIQVICVLALIDQYRGLLQIRRHLGLVDIPLQLELKPADPSLTGAGLSVVTADPAVVIFLSTKCVTCRIIGQGLRGNPLPSTSIILEGPQDTQKSWLEELGLSNAGVIEDRGGEIASRLGVEAFPAALVFRAGRLTHAQTLPSYRQLEQLLDRTLGQTGTRFADTIPLPLAR